MPDGSGITLTGNTWKYIDIDAITLTPNTILRLEFSASVEGEMQGIGFENDGNVGFGNLFKLHGTQNFGNRDYDNLYTTGNAPRFYEIAVGQVLSGTFDRIIFVNDDDGADAGESTIQNIQYGEPGSLTTINFGTSGTSAPGGGTTQNCTPQLPILSVQGHDVTGAYSPSTDGSGLTITGNTWRYIDIAPITLTPNSILRVDFSAAVEAEMQGIGLENDGNIAFSNLFKLHGTQNFGNRDHDNLYTTGAAPLFYWRAPIGWSGLIVSALWVSGPLARCFRAQAGDIPMRCAA